MAEKNICTKKYNHEKLHELRRPKTKSEQSKWMQSEQREVSQQKQGKSGGGDSEKFTPHSNSRRQSRKEHRQEKSGWITKTSVPDNWQNFQTQSPVRNGDDGISSRLDGITFPKWRNESIKAGGNAVVPQVVHQIFKTIEQYGSIY